VIRSPIVDLTRAQATVSAASGETIVLGGLITKSTEELNRRVPYLADIPVLGNLFRYEGFRDKRTELLIILTPHVILTPEDNERLKQTEMARMSWCAAQVYDIHGDIGFALENDCQTLDSGTEIIYPDVNPRGTSPLLYEPSESISTPPDSPSFRDSIPSAQPIDETYDQGPPELPLPGPTGWKDGMGETESRGTRQEIAHTSAHIRRLPPADEVRMANEKVKVLR
jgi:hypothetical protein